MHPEWQAALADALASPRMAALRRFLDERKAAGATIYPLEDDIFSALALTPPSAVKAVILGQDPYHQPGQAHGLAFSVRPGVPVPRSLGNIYKELQADLGIAPPRHGCLQAWAERGVLLLNNLLTVEEGRPLAHRKRGWEEFTDAVVAALANGPDPVAFLLWGDEAQRKGASIDGSRHLVIRTSHPSPLSARRSFFGSRPFSRTNDFLAKAGRGEIDWSLPAELP